MTNSLLSLGLFIFMLSLLVGLKKKKISLSLRIMLSLFLGIGYGFCLRLFAINLELFGITSLLHLIGYGYLTLLKMLVIPLILTSIIYTILHVGKGNAEMIKKMSLITCLILLLMTGISSAIGLWVGKWFQVGAGMILPTLNELPTHPYTGIADTLLGMLPSNPITMMGQDNTIAVVIFSVLIGLSARLLETTDPDKTETFRQLIAALFAIVKKLTSLILELTPYGIFALLSLLLLNQGAILLSGIMHFVMAMYVAIFLVMMLHTLILMFAGYHPWRYFKFAYTPLLVAFTTRSSFGTLPFTEKTLREKFKTNSAIATFAPSIGATIGMNACAGVFPAMLVMMTLTMLHQPLTPHLIFMVMFINAIASLGISGIPGTAYIAATITLTSLNLPYAVIALVQGVDPLVDMGRTAANVNGVMMAALIADRLIEIDEKEQEVAKSLEAEFNRSGF